MLQESKYKAGDRVLVSHHSAELPVGGEYVVASEAKATYSSRWINIEGHKHSGTYDGSFKECWFSPAVAAPKFKVGDRVVPADGDEHGLFDHWMQYWASEGDERPEFFYVQYVVATDVGDHVTYGAKLGEIGPIVPERDLQHFEPAPLFAVGDKVLVTGCIAGRVPFVGEYGTIASTGKSLSVELNSGGTYYFAPSELTATTDDEAGGNGNWSSPQFVGDSHSATTGFTIPTDEEALPPKVDVYGIWVEGNKVTIVADKFLIEETPSRPFIFNEGKLVVNAISRPEFVLSPIGYGKVIARHGDKTWLDFGGYYDTYDNSELEAA